MPASSMITRVSGPMLRTQAGSARQWVQRPDQLRQRVGVAVQLLTRAGARPPRRGPARSPCRRCRSRPWTGRSWRSSCPDPAGAIANCTRAPEVAISRTSSTWPGFSRVPLASVSSSARSTAVAGATFAVPKRRRPAPAGLRRPASPVEVNSCAPATLYTLAPSLRRNGAGSAGSPQAGFGERLDTAARHAPPAGRPTASTRSAGTCDGADVALRFGPQMPGLPAGAARLHMPQHEPRGALHPCVIRPSRRMRPATGGGRCGSSGVIAVARCPARRRLAPARWRAARPGCAVRAWRRGFPGWPAGPARSTPPGSVGGHDRAGNAAARSRRRASMERRRVDQRWFRSGVDADDFTHRHACADRARPGLEPHPERGGQVPLQGGVVGLRGGHHRLVQHPAVDRQPAAIRRRFGPCSRPPHGCADRGHRRGCRGG